MFPSPRLAVGGISSHSSYHPGGYGMSEGLKRARRPFIVRNAITGTLIFGFAIGVYTYSIRKVKQDDFSDLGDVRAPNAPVQSTASAAGASQRPATTSGSPAAALTGPSTISTASPQQQQEAAADKRRLV